MIYYLSNLECITRVESVVHMSVYGPIQYHTLRYASIVLLYICSYLSTDKNNTDIYVLLRTWRGIGSYLSIDRYTVMLLWNLKTILATVFIGEMYLYSDF